MDLPTHWKKCSSCKKDIPFRPRYYLCSVSTCRHKRTGFRFCSVPCWDAHLGYANHRSSFAEEVTSPSAEDYLKELQAEQSETATRPAKRVIVNPIGGLPATSGVSAPSLEGSVETLVVVSRVKALISELSGFNTSQCCIDALTKRIVGECKKGIERATAAGRKTVMGRDIG